MTTEVNGHEAPQSGKPGVNASDVGWQFVPQYYNFVSGQPHRLHCFYNKRSAFLHGDESDDTPVALGQQEIHDRIQALGFKDTKVYINSIDSQSSQNGGIVILVIGEMANAGGPWRKFTQTFFLAEQPGGYFVLNDIFRFLKEDEEDEEEEGQQGQADVDEPSASTSNTTATAVQEEPVKLAEPVEEVQSRGEEIKQEEAPIKEEEAAPAEEVGNGPEPTTAPAHPDPKTVPEEAEVAAVPDKDVAPSEPAPATASATEEPAAPQSNGTEKSTPVPTPAAPAPTSAPAQAQPPKQAPAQPAAPPKPAAPKTWASLAAAAATPRAAPAPAAKSAAAPAQTSGASAQENAAAPVQPQQQQQQQQQTQGQQQGQQGNRGPHPFYKNAMNAQTPICFVKLPNWTSSGTSGPESIDQETLRSAASRFGEVASLEFVSGKACAFVEFKQVESARKAIAASLPVAQGGEGGIKLPGQTAPVLFEPRKEKDERRPKQGQQGQGQGQGQGQQQQGQGQGQQQRGQNGPMGQRYGQQQHQQRQQGPGQQQQRQQGQQQQQQQQGADGFQQQNRNRGRKPQGQAQQAK